MYDKWSKKDRKEHVGKWLMITFGCRIISTFIFVVYMSMAQEYSEANQKYY